MKKIVIWDWDGAVVDSITYKYVYIWKEVFPGREDVVLSNFGDLRNILD